MGDVLREKYVKLCVKLLSIHRDYMIDNKAGISTIKRVIKSGREIRVNANIYNKVLMMIMYARIIFRQTKSLDLLSAYNDDLKEANKCVKELYKEIKAFDEDPDSVAAYVRCGKDKIRKILKEIDQVIHDMDDIIHDMEQDVEMTQENYKIMNKLVKIYTLRANTVHALVYSINVLLKHKE